MLIHKFNVYIEIFLISIGTLKIQRLQASKDKVEANDGQNKLVLLLKILSPHIKKYLIEEYYEN